jgi:hypothetical protein
MRSHTGEKPHTCDVVGCGKAFAKSCTLKMHMRSHTGERPYGCDVIGCGKAFAQSSTLKSHMRSHMGEKPYTCEVVGCLKSFVRSYHLKSHMRVHTGEKPYQCKTLGCDQKFRTSSARNVHQKRWHTAVGIQRQKKTESWVATQLKAAGFAMDRELTIDFKCINSPGKCARVDHVIYFENYIVLVETDELSCELRRMTDVVASIRCSGDVRKILRKDKMARLVTFLHNYKPTQDCEIAYFFYDTTKNQPAIFADVDYSDGVKRMVTQVIF